MEAVTSHITPVATNIAAATAHMQPLKPTIQVQTKRCSRFITRKVVEPRVYIGWGIDFPDASGSEFLHTFFFFYTSLWRKWTVTAHIDAVIAHTASVTAHM